MHKPYQIWQNNIRQICHMVANNEPNTEELEKQKKYVSCQDLQFTFVISKSSTEKLKNSIKEQTYSKFKIEEFENQEEIKNITNSESDYTILSSGNIELAPFTLYEIVKSQNTETL